MSNHKGRFQRTRKDAVKNPCLVCNWIPSCQHVVVCQYLVCIRWWFCCRFDGPACNFVLLGPACLTASSETWLMHSCPGPFIQLTCEQWTVTLTFIGLRKCYENVKRLTHRTVPEPLHLNSVWCLKSYSVLVTVTLLWLYRQVKSYLMPWVLCKYCKPAQKGETYIFNQSHRLHQQMFCWQLSVSLYCEVEGSLRRMRQSALSADLDQVPARADPASHEETTSQIKHCRDEKLSPVFSWPWLYGLIIFLLFRQNIPEGDNFKSVFHYGGQLGIDISVSDCSSDGWRGRSDCETCWKQILWRRASSDLEGRGLGSSLWWQQKRVELGGGTSCLSEPGLCKGPEGRSWVNRVCSGVR